MAISDSELEALSADPLEAFIEFEVLARAELEANQDDNGWDAEFEYIGAITQFISVYDLPRLLVPNMPTLESGNFGSFFVMFRRSVNERIWRTRLVRAKDEKSGNGNSLTLLAETKSILHFHLNQMREAIENIEFDQEKKDEILKKINELAKGIDTSKTAWRHWMDLTIDIAVVAGIVGDKIIPIRKTMDAILKRLGQASSELRQLTTPKPRLLESSAEMPAPDIEAGAESDDIPF